MPLVPLKKVLSVSSEDSVHTASSLLSPASGLQWLSAGNYRGKRTEVDLELAKLTRLGRVEVGNSGSAFVEVLVRNSHDAEYISLLPQSIMMSSEESRSGRNHMRIKVFSKEKLNKAALDKKWCFVKVRCTQPYSNSQQYGLKFIRFFSTDVAAPSPSLSPTSSSPLLTMRSPTTPHDHTPRQPLSSPSYRGSLTPSLPSRSTSRGEGSRLATTPKRPCLREGNETVDRTNEFSGVEKQSRLLKCTLSNSRPAVENNSILERIAAEKEKEKSEFMYARKKLLHKELSKAAADSGVDFAATYSAQSDSSGNVAGLRAVRGLSALDNNCEIGEEDTRKFRRRSEGAEGGGGWKRRRYHKKPKKHQGISIFFMPIRKDKSVEQDDDDGSCCSGVKDDSGNSVTPLIDLDKKGDDDVICTSGPPPLGDGEVWESCPVCGEKLPAYALEVHANLCANEAYSPILVD